MSHAELAKTIDDAFEARDGIGPATKGAVREAALDLEQAKAPGGRQGYFMKNSKSLGVSGVSESEELSEHQSPGGISSDRQHNPEVG